MREMLRLIHSRNPHFEQEQGIVRCEKLTKSGEQCGREASPDRDDLARIIKLCEHHRGPLLLAAKDALAHEQIRMKREALSTRRRRSVVYFVRRRGGDIKIGYTSDLAKRLYVLRREYGHLELLATALGGREAEARLHERFADLRIDQTEWFRPRARLVNFVAVIAALPKAA